MEREEMEEAGPSLTAAQPQHKGKDQPVAPMQEEGGKDVVAAVPGLPHHSLDNDSGYSSYVLPPSESSLPGSSLSHSSSCPSLTPVVGRVTTRLTSTPHNNTSQDVFPPPSPKIEAIACVVVERRRSRHNSTSASPITTTSLPSRSPFLTPTTATTLEMHELEMTCHESSSNVMPQRTRNKPGTAVQEENKFEKDTIHTTQPRVKLRVKAPQETPTRSKANLGVRMPPPATKRAISRLRRPQSAFIRLLREADYLLCRVLQYLSGEDLLCLSQVNQQLRQLILKDKTLRERRTMYLTTRRSDRNRVGKENYKLKRLNTEGSSSSHSTLSPRKQLSAIQNLGGNSSPVKASQPPPPPLAQRFMEEGEKLTKGEELQKCVKCKSPAVVSRSQLRARCSLKTCGYDYCISCHLPAHRRPQDCLSLRPRTRQAAAGIFSNRCKKNLRRL